ncbi:MAG: WhiB family transcriptional regulator [Candidatus Nanopelagicales bacterium]|jgi:WhiB family transcriptional regulator, redox-sensing transcriptional regulator|nr:WhiB family transcriptional regulator [Candidatus Nanopelagicales bacterium]MDP4895943.1 WhiB family transcriptional regulator [Candidatus Nanopelagicales bacterium]
MADLSRLPGPNADFWDWQLDSACRGLDSDIFYHPDGERGSARERRVATAKAICAACPVMAQCRAHALKTKEPYGVWGGLGEEDREVIYAQQASQSRLSS